MRPRSRRASLAPPDAPLIVAHRGASTARAEHTLAAYETALATGADGLECDVRLTRDGHLICVHDRTVDRTSDGRGVVSELELRTLEEFDFASRHSELPDSADELIADSPYLAGVAPDRAEDGRILTLEQLLSLVADAGRPVRLLVETKHPTRYGGLVEKELVTLLGRFGWAGRPGPPVSSRQPAGPRQPGDRHELRADRDPPGSAAGAGRAHRAAHGAPAAGTARTPAAARRRDRRAVGAPAAVAIRGSSSAPTPAVTGCSSGR